jgi:hypothetical protein
MRLPIWTASVEKRNNSDLIVVIHSLGTDKFYLSLLERPLAMMHVMDAVLDSFSNLFRSHRYSPLEKIYSVILFTAGLSLREMKEGSILQQRKLEDIEEHRRVGNCNCSDAQRHQGRRRGGNTNLLDSTVYCSKKAKGRS